MKRNHLTMILTGWISILVLSYFLNIYLMKLNTSKIARNKGESFFSEIVTTRLWNSIHGGVYVPVTETTQPNPYLKVADRDIETTMGRKLTKINPAYMTRQIAELAEKQNDIKYHITSLNPIRPENIADEWEHKVLEGFEENQKSVLHKVNTDSISYYRFMAPLITELSCLDCHADQGYKVGDIRGGIIVSFRDDVYITAEVKQTIALSLIHVVVLFLGIFGLKYYERMSNIFLFELKIKNDKLEENQFYQQQLNKDLREINAAKDRLFSIIAHDLKSPFTLTLGYSDLLLTNFNEYSDEKKHEMINIISESNRKSFNLLENLLIWAQSQIGRIKYYPEKVDIKIISNSIIELYQSHVKKKEILLKNNIQESIELISDRNIIETILRNLVSNAVKYTNKAGTVTLDCCMSYTNKQVEITVTDRGLGMSEEMLSMLFKVDKNISTVGTEKEMGTGLGLILCNELVKIIGGEIKVESKLGIGSKFNMIIPINNNQHL